MRVYIDDANNGFVFTDAQGKRHVYRDFKGLVDHLAFELLSWNQRQMWEDGDPVKIASMLFKDSTIAGEKE